MIAMALACDPEILIADEPTTALDVTIQAQILQLVADLQRETGMAIMLITHNLGVVAQACDAVAVMYMGRVVEAAPTRDLLANPMHPYTRVVAFGAAAWCSPRGGVHAHPRCCSRPRRSGFWVRLPPSL